MVGADLRLDYFGMLELEEGASVEDVREAYFRLAKEHHPDHGGDPLRFWRLTDAYKLLGFQENRETYLRLRRSLARADEFDRVRALEVERFAQQRTERLECIRSRSWWSKALRRLGLKAGH